MTTNFDFTSYISSANLLQRWSKDGSKELKDSSKFEVTLLSGGYTNFTARVTFAEPRSFAPASPSDQTYKSVILKHAPPYIATSPSVSLSIVRQVTEVRALELITGAPIQFDLTRDISGHAGGSGVDSESRALNGITEEGVQTLKRVLDKYPIIQVPAVIHHDTEKNVLWLEDLGDLKSVADALVAPPSDQAGTTPGEDLDSNALEKLATQLGSFLAEFYEASKTLPSELVDRLVTLSNVYTSGTFEFWVNSTQDALAEAPGTDEKERAEFVRRVEASLTDNEMRKARRRAEKVALGIVHDNPIQTDDEENPCLGMVDFWPGSVLVSTDWNKCGLIDWEYFGMSDEASELGMFLAHMHIARFKPNTSLVGQERLGKFMSALFQAYNRHSPSTSKIRSKDFQRRFLISHGRELVNGIELYKNLGAEGSQHVMAAGIRSLRAAGPSIEELNLEALWEGADENRGNWIRDILSSLGFLASGTDN